VEAEPLSLSRLSQPSTDLPKGRQAVWDDNREQGEGNASQDAGNEQ
jgi:hypothetical protein